MIILHPYAKKLRTGMPHPKDYPHWKELAELLDQHVIQIGIEGEAQIVEDFRRGLSLKEIEALVRTCDYWIAVDSFLPHLAKHIGKRGVVIWSFSDPLIFGYPENINILKDRKYLRAKQFDIWESCGRVEEAFLSPQCIMDFIKRGDLLT